MPENKIYFAGGIFGDKPETQEFKLVHPTGIPEVAYVTKNPDGLKTTSHHASLYTLDDDNQTAIRVALRSDNAPERIKLTDKQLKMLQNGIFTN